MSQPSMGQSAKNPAIMPIPKGRRHPGSAGKRLPAGTVVYWQGTVIRLLG
jgi:hypothetical protein